MSRWFFVRHAAVDLAEARLSGRSDVSIRPPDPQQLAWLKRQLPATPEGEMEVFRSSLKRSAETLQALNLHTNASALSDFDEQDFGEWEGQSWQRLGQKAAAFWLDPAGSRPPGGESFIDVCLRVTQAMHRLHAQSPEKDKLLLVHAGSIRAALALALELSPAKALRFVVAPLSLTILTAHSSDEGLSWSVEAVNRTAQLPEAS